MKKQFQIEVSGQKPLTINLVENEAIDIHISNSASKFVELGAPQTEVKVSGMRWAGEDFFNFRWRSHTLNVNDSVSVKLVEDTRSPTPVSHEEKYIQPEQDCAFCHRKQSEVPHLVVRSLFARICSDCIVECQKLVDSKGAI